MRNHPAVFIAVLLLILCCAGTAHAKMISGKVVSTDPSTRKVTLSVMEVISGKTSKVDVWVDAQAGFEGISSLNDLKAGDSCWVEAETDSEGNLRASKIAKA